MISLHLTVSVSSVSTGTTSTTTRLAPIVEDWARQNQLPYARVDNIERHQWTGPDQLYNCIYKVVIGRQFYIGTAEQLELRVCGLHQALWMYWSDRPRVQARCVERYMTFHGHEGFYREVMWHYLPMPQFLEMWRARRVSRRA